MNLIIYFVLIVGPSIIIMGKPNPVPSLTKDDIDRYANEKKSIITGSSEHTLLLANGGYDGEIDDAVVCKGYFDSEPVTIKIFKDKASMQEEMKLYNDLLAMQDPKPEWLDIPKLYYSGQVLGNYHAIALTFTEEQSEIEIEDEIILSKFETKPPKSLRRVHFKEQPELRFQSTDIDELLEEDDKLATRHRPFPRYAGLDKEESKTATRTRKIVRGTENDNNDEGSSSTESKCRKKCLNLKGRISRKLLEAKLDFQLLRRKLLK